MNRSSTHFTKIAINVLKHFWSFTRSCWIKTYLKFTADSYSAASFNLLMLIMRDGQLRTLRQTLQFSIFISQTFRFLSSNILSSPAYVIFELADHGLPGLASLMNILFLRAAQLSHKLLERGYVRESLNSSLMNCYGQNRDLINQYEVSLS